MTKPKDPHGKVVSRPPDSDGFDLDAALSRAAESYVRRQSEPAEETPEQVSARIAGEGARIRQLAEEHNRVSRGNAHRDLDTARLDYRLRTDARAHRMSSDGAPALDAPRRDSAREQARILADDQGTPNARHLHGSRSDREAALRQATNLRADLRPRIVQEGVDPDMEEAYRRAVDAAARIDRLEDHRPSAFEAHDTRLAETRDVRPARERQRIDTEAALAREIPGGLTPGVRAVHQEMVRGVSPFLQQPDYRPPHEESYGLRAGEGEVDSDARRREALRRLMEGGEGSVLL